MGLLPLEFSDCLTDSPFFRENLRAHEKELERTSQSIKILIREVKDVVNAATSLSKAQRNLSNSLLNFKFECIGSSQTDDEIVIANALREIGGYIATVDDELDRMLTTAHKQFVSPLEDFRKRHIGAAKEGKKKFDKQTSKFCQSLERHLNLSTKKPDGQLKEADATLEMEQRAFCQASLEYIFRLQEVQERKKFEFVETLLGFMYSWLTFYHNGHEIAKDFRPYMTTIQEKLQKTRANFSATHEKAETLMHRMMEKAQDTGSLNKMYTRQGYLFLMEKKALGTTWCKQYCQYQKDSRKFTMFPYAQTVGKITTSETLVLRSCVRRMSDTIEKRFCFDITAEDKQGVFTFQALSEEDRQLWMNAMDGKEPTYSQSGGRSPKGEETQLDEVGFSFVEKCIAALESRGLEEQGLYRLVGVSSKVSKLHLMGLDKRKQERLNLDDKVEWECKTITSALKNFFRNLPEPLMTFRLHSAFITATKHECRKQRIDDIHALVHYLPKENFQILKMLIQHLCNVAMKADRNLMTVSNLGVCFGPTLLRPEEETVAAIMDIKFGNIVVEILIDNYDKIFNDIPENNDAIRRLVPPAPVPSSALSTRVPHATVALHGAFFALGSSGLNFADNMLGGLGAKSISSPGLAHSTTTTTTTTTTTNSSACHATPQSKPGPAVPHALSFINPLGLGGEVANNMDVCNNSSSSSDSVNSKSSREFNNHRRPPPIKSNAVSHANDVSLAVPKPSSRINNDHRFSSLGKRSSKDNGDATTLIRQASCSTTSLPALSMQQISRRVRTLYHCLGENESELSFEPNQIITNVRPSREPGWLEGTLKGKTGLIPENYVEYLT